MCTVEYHVVLVSQGSILTSMVLEFYYILDFCQICWQGLKRAVEYVKIVVKESYHSFI